MYLDFYLCQFDNLIIKLKDIKKIMSYRKKGLENDKDTRRLRFD